MSEHRTWGVWTVCWIVAILQGAFGAWLLTEQPLTLTTGVVAFSVLAAAVWTAPVP